jgi:hypothetical protein
MLPPSILVLGRDTCEDTTRSRAWLDANAVGFAYRKVDEDPDAEALSRSLNDGALVTPLIVIGDLDRPDRILIEPSDEELEAAIHEVAALG